MRASGLCLAVCVLFANSARANHPSAGARGVLAPTPEAPAEVQGGQPLSMMVRVASGLTPPPGIQTERALRGFAARLCGSSGCTPLIVRNVRPIDAHSFVYRVEAPLPTDVESGLYDLELRFPGGTGYVPRAVRVSPLHRAVAPAPPQERQLASGGCALNSPDDDTGVAGLLLLAVSWKLAASRGARGRRWNTSSVTPVPETP